MSTIYMVDAGKKTECCTSVAAAMSQHIQPYIVRFNVLYAALIWMTQTQKHPP